MKSIQILLLAVSAASASMMSQAQPYSPKQQGDVPKKYKEGYVPHHVKGIFGHAASKLGGLKRSILGGEKWVKDENHPIHQKKNSMNSMNSGYDSNYSKGYNNKMEPINNIISPSGMNNKYGMALPSSPSMGSMSASPMGSMSSMPSISGGSMEGSSMMSGVSGGSVNNSSSASASSYAGSSSGPSGSVSVSGPSSNSSFMSSSDIKDGIAAASVISNYYDTLVQRKGAIGGITPISGIMAYPVSNGVYTDYWGKIQFTMGQDGVLVDSSGYFTGEPVGSKNEILTSGYLSDIGFYQKKGIPKEMMDQNYISTKMLIEEIASATQKDVQALHNEKIDLNFLEGIFDYFKKQKRRDRKKSCMTVCICSNSTCSGACKSIKCVEPMYLL
ncbi:hypothetical protein NEMIN01_1092 [Nematocida minor]|uniref:uncharacterized protein n=1 Tax=Nematocida minor TaxID=1912983 RepID=UPI00221E8790|nr:uncharacterized protein NEMIN01_1092 [Nematocida minor]KAI5190554.1 hypothetical protein NEMIN01_1092 [Nematocida minor]